MMMRVRLWGRVVRSGGLLAMLSLALAFGHTARADLITNGNFASPGVGGGFNIYSSVPGWTVSADGIEIDNSQILGLACHDADCQSAEVNANTFDTITQSVTGLVVGNTYMLSWAYGDRSGSGPQRLNVSFGNRLITTDYGTGASTWTTNSFLITATATTENLVFQAINVGGQPAVGNEIDDVSLVPTTPVPEPGTLALLAVGLAGLGIVQGRRSL
jgi:hypothetical protein